MEREGRTILVSGATGHQGGATARHLLADGWHVRALTRHPDSPAARELAGLGAEVVEGDLLDRASVDRAVAGAYGAFSVQAFREAGTEGEEREGRNLTDAAKAAGVRHLVYDSVIGAGTDRGVLPYVASKHHLEAYVRDSGVPWTIWRPCTFMENFLRQRDDIASGVVRSPEAPRTLHQYVAVDDIGGFAALAFREPEAWQGRTTLIAGDRMPEGDVAAVFSRVLGRPVAYEQTPPPGGTPPPSGPPELADVERLRALLPGLKTLEAWARTIEWVPVPAGAGR